MPNNPEQPDDVDVLLQKYAASRQTFAANAPDLHEADIRRLAAEARHEWHKRALSEASLWERLRGLVASLTSPQWAAAAVTAVVVLVFAVWLPQRESGGEGRQVAKAEQGTKVTSATPPGSGSQLFAMVVTPNRGETVVPPDAYRQFDLNLNLDANQVALKFRDGTTLTGILLPDDGDKPAAGEPLSYAVSASGADSQHQPIRFKGLLVAVRDPASPNRAKEVSLRGTLTANQQEIPLAADMKKP